MSVQVFLQGRVFGIEQFLSSSLHVACGEKTDERLLIGRSRWVALLAEVLPRALLAELGLSRMLLGTSGGGQFLLVIPDEARPEAERFLRAAAADISRLSNRMVTLDWAATENLGDWTLVRKRLNEEMRKRRSTPAADGEADFFQPFPLEPSSTDADEYFTLEMAVAIREAQLVGWSPETPGPVLADKGKPPWAIGASADAIPRARHSAPDDTGARSADRNELAGRAEGRAVWGVLRGDVDNFDIRIRRLTTIEEHVQLSVMYKQFFAGELEIVCSMPEFWRKVSIIYSGGDDFAVYGSWDGLIQLAREIQRLFHRLTEENMKDFPGLEGKTISMAMTLAPEPDAPLAAVYQESGRKLALAKATEKHCIHLLGRTLEWKQLAYASELKDNMSRMIREFAAPPQFLRELAGLYRESADGRDGALDRPWRLHGRLNRVLGPTRDRDFQRSRTTLLTDLVGKGASQKRLRPSGRVALEWAKLSTGV
ncbi:MAG: hypothetical protein KJZ78_12555 [Bryobacteraceae bacterium]|nr:hypothetical protein [Bryobacteraceae bacterium]